jgi:hypothetical protein
MGGGARVERRLYARARLVASATAWVGGLCRGSYIVENLSLAGIYLSGGPSLREGDEVKLLLELPRGPVEVRGQVLRSRRRARDAAVAVRFDQPQRQAREAIGEAVAEALERAAEESSVRPEPTVLVVDESVLVREALARDMRCFGREAACFATPLDALTFLARPESAIHIAMVDRAAVGAGGAMLALLAEERPAIRRVLLSRETSLLTPDALIADVVLAKPWDYDALSSTLIP